MLLPKHTIGGPASANDVVGVGMSSPATILPSRPQPWQQQADVAIQGMSNGSSSSGNGGGGQQQQKRGVTGDEPTFQRKPFPGQNQDVDHASRLCLGQRLTRTLVALTSSHEHPQQQQQHSNGSSSADGGPNSNPSRGGQIVSLSLDLSQTGQNQMSPMPHALSLSTNPNMNLNDGSGSGSRSLSARLAQLDLSMQRPLAARGRTPPPTRPASREGSTRIQQMMS